MFRPEFPDPQFRRENWVNLNGPWSFAFDKEDNGADKKFFERTSFDGVIEVPFCPRIHPCPASAIPTSSTPAGIPVFWTFPSRRFPAG